MSDTGGGVGRRITRGFLVISSWTTLTRVSGMLREMTLAFFFGAGRGMDVLLVALTVPNLFRLVLAEKAVESAFLPTYKQLVARGEEERARRVGSTVLTVTTLLACTVVLLGQTVVPWIVGFLAPGFEGEQLSTAIGLTRIVFPFLILVSWAAFVGSIHLANERFKLYSAAPMAYNAGMILTAALLERWLGITAAALGALVGGAAFFLVQVPFLRSGDGRGRGGFWYRPRLDHRDPEARKVGRLTLPVLLEAALTKSATVVDRNLASRLATGSISALSYSMRILELPLALIGRSMGRSVQSVVAEAYGLGRIDRIRESVLSSLRMLAFLTGPVTLLTILAADSVVGVLFRRGAFDHEAARAAGYALRFYAPGLLGFCGIALLTRVFYSMDDTRIPLIASGIAMSTNILGNLALYRTPLGYGGIALASSLGGWVGMLFLLERLLRRLRRLGEPLTLPELLVPVGRMIPPLVALVLAGLGAARLMAPVLPGTFLGDGCRIVVVGAVGVAAFLGGARLTRCEEMERLQRRLAARRKR